jgi:hypothetical protein
MSANKIDILLDLWAATLLKHSDEPPFADHKDLYDTIDSTPLGDVQWQSFNISYNGPDKPEHNAPPWMDAEYEVWFRDPHSVIRNMIANPDFHGEIDYAPFQEYDTNHSRRYQHFMSGEWAWDQAVNALLSGIQSHLTRCCFSE